MPNNEFLPFATGANANVQDQTSYAADGQTTNGQTSGIASSARNNKALRQGTFVAACIAQFGCDLSGNDSLDDGNMAEFIANFELALQNYIWQTVGKVTAGPNTNLHMMVETTGNDSTADGSAAFPFLTIQAAYNHLQSKFNCNGYTPVIDVGGGTYSTGGALGGGGAMFSGPIVGQNQPFLLTTHGGSVTINALGIGFYANQGASVQIGGTWVLNTGLYTPGGAPNSTLVAEVGGFIAILPSDQSNLTFGPALSGAHIQSAAGGLIAVEGGYYAGGQAHPGAYTITGGAQVHQVASQNATIINGIVTVTTQNNPTFSGAFLIVTDVGIIDIGGNTFVGPAVGNTYSASNNGVINAGGRGEGYLPGSIRPGGKSTGGQYN